MSVKALFIERMFTAKQRKTLAKSGAAMKDGSYPIENRGDLENAIRAIGRATDPAATKAHIRKRAKALGATDLIPDDWSNESFVEVPERMESLLYEADGVTPKSESFDAIRQRLQCALETCIKAGEDMDLDGDNDSGCCYCAWVCDVFPDTVVYSMDGKLFQCSYEDGGDVVTLGTPVQVEQAYSVVEDEDDSDDDTQESDRTSISRKLCAEVSQFKEAAYDASTGTLSLTVIKPGLNKSKERFYPAEVLKRDYKIFEGAKMFADHQSDKESRERPEGSVHNWVASVNKVWAEADGTVKANAVVIDPPFKAKLEELGKQNLLHEMGVSIRAIGEAVAGKIGQVKTNIVESLLRARSVDFVTYAGAGGMVEAIEAETSENDLDLVSEADLRQRRPDLVELIETSANHSHQHEGDRMKTLEQELKEAKEQLATANQSIKALKETNDTQRTQLTALTTKLEEAETTAKKAAAATELTKLLTESKLPELGRKRVALKFAEAVSSDGMKEAIEEESNYIKSVGGSSRVTNMGERHNSTQISESDRTKLRKEKLMRGGMKEADAEAFANARR